MDKIKQNELPEIWDDTHYSDVKSGIKYWTYQMNGYKCHLFTCELTADQINRFWNNIVSLIAMDFQTSLKLEIERWNIYVIFLTPDRCSKEMKYRIEQDKYSCRKLVEDGLHPSELTEEGIIGLLEKILFTIKVNTIDVDKSSEESSAAIIKNMNAAVFKALEGFESNKQVAPFYEKLLKSPE